MRDYPTLHLDTKSSTGTFHSHGRVFNNEKHSYTKMSVTQT